MSCQTHMCVHHICGHITRHVYRHPTRHMHGHITRHICGQITRHIHGYITNMWASHQRGTWAYHQTCTWASHQTHTNTHAHLRSSLHTPQDIYTPEYTNNDPSEGRGPILTINKPQGPSLGTVGLDLHDPVFAHGQFYMGVSRGTNWSRVKVLLKEGRQATNIVCKDVLLRPA
jgi:hypothetical protein